jgi:LemA protein
MKLNLLLSSGATIVIVVVVALIVIFVGWAISVVNTAKRMMIKIDEAESGIDVALTQRFDMLNKLFQAAKGYMKHEAETLQKVVQMRQPKHTDSIESKQEFADQITRGLNAINVVVEQYPDLKASKNVETLQNATIEIEENLQAARRVYNANVSRFNQFIVVFPNSIFTGKYQKRAFFEAEAVKRQDVTFDF